MVEETASSSPGVASLFLRQQLSRWWRKWRWLVFCAAVPVIAVPLLRWAAFVAFAVTTEMYRSGAHHHWPGSLLFQTMPFWMSVKDFFNAGVHNTAICEGTLLLATLFAVAHARSLMAGPPPAIARNDYSRARLGRIRLVIAVWVVLLGVLPVLAFAVIGHAYLWYELGGFADFLLGYLLWLVVIALWMEYLVVAILTISPALKTLGAAVLLYLASVPLRWLAWPDVYGDTLAVELLSVVVIFLPVLSVWALIHLWRWANRIALGSDHPTV